MRHYLVINTVHVIFMFNVQKFIVVQLFKNNNKHDKKLRIQNIKKKRVKTHIP